MKRLICLLACLLLLLPCARAVTVLTKGDDAAKRLADARDAMKGMAVGHYGMIPITGVPDGAYPVKVESSSAFFKITDATLTVENGAMTLDFLIGSESYLRVCRAFAADAESAEWIEGEVVENGTRFTVPVPALNEPFELAAFSKARQIWYDRWLLVDASSLPGGTLPYALPDYGLIDRAMSAYIASGAPEEAAPEVQPVKPVQVNRPDGEYAIEVNLSGGSGRASVSSPTVLVVREGKAWARLLWSSAYYDYMLVGGERYENLSEGGNSTFEIPIGTMDEPMTVIADTTAMGDPVEIEYRLTFYGESIGDKSQVPQEAAKKVLLISLAIILVGGVLNYFVKKRRR